MIRLLGAGTVLGQQLVVLRCLHPLIGLVGRRAVLQSAGVLASPCITPSMPAVSVVIRIFTML
jgi:hypothetical protein